MHGNRKITEYAPDGKTSETVFAVKGFSAGIQQGVTISLWVKNGRGDGKAEVYYRDDLHDARAEERRKHLLATLDEENFQENFVKANADRENRFSFRPSDVSDEYQNWAKLTDIAARLPEQGLLECRGGALIDIDKNDLSERMKKYFDANVSWEDLEKLETGLTKDMARFDSKKTRAKVTLAENFSDKRIKRYAIRAFDSRWCYFSSIRPLWNEPRPQFVQQITDENMFLVSRPAGVASPEGVPFYFVRGFADYDLLRGHARYFPFRLRVVAQSKENQPSLLGETEETFTANLSAKARNYLRDLGADDPDESADAASLIWLHALAIGYAPLYLTENADGIRSDFPRIPLPAELEILQTSARRGRRIAELLDTERATAETDGLPFTAIGVISRVADGQIRIESGELEISAGWGSGGKGGITMPGKGKTVKRDYTPGELKILEESAARFSLSAGEITQILGAQTFDVYLNDAAFWRNIPAAVWEYTIGGYQVLKKWLSYREAAVLGKSLTADEAREVSSIVRRITAILLLSKDLNANYKACKSSEFKL